MTAEETKSLELIFKTMGIAPDGFFPTFKAGYEFARAEKTDKTDQFLSYLDENIVRIDKTLAGSPIQSRRFEDAMEHRSVYASVKEKFVQLLNNQIK